MNIKPIKPIDSQIIVDNIAIYSGFIIILIFFYSLMFMLWDLMQMAAYPAYFPFWQVNS
jgi:hypothetical protein